MHTKHNPYRIIATVALALTWAVPCVADDTDTTISGELSPDGSLVLFSAFENGDFEIFTAHRDGSQRKQLTDNDAWDHHPAWSPDGKRIAFISNLTGTMQVHTVGLDGQDVEQVTSDPKGVGQKVAYLPDGRLSYPVFRRRVVKSTYYDLVVRDGNQTQPIATNLQLTDFAWHANGKALVIGALGQITFLDLENETETVVGTSDIDERLDYYRVHEIKWQPGNDTIKCRIEFWGGRREGTKLFGDDEQFTVSRDGKASWSKLGS